MFSSISSAAVYLSYLNIRPAVVISACSTFSSVLASLYFLLVLFFCVVDSPASLCFLYPVAFLFLLLSKSFPLPFLLFYLPHSPPRLRNRASKSFVSAPFVHRRSRLGTAVNIKNIFFPQKNFLWNIFYFFLRNQYMDFYLNPLPLDLLDLGHSGDFHLLDFVRDRCHHPILSPSLV